MDNFFVPSLGEVNGVVFVENNFYKFERISSEGIIWKCQSSETCESLLVTCLEGDVLKVQPHSHVNSEAIQEFSSEELDFLINQLDVDVNMEFDSNFNENLEDLSNFLEMNEPFALEPAPSYPVAVAPRPATTETPSCCSSVNSLCFLSKNIKKIQRRHNTELRLRKVLLKHRLQKKVAQEAPIKVLAKDLEKHKI